MNEGTERKKERKKKIKEERKKERKKDWKKERTKKIKYEIWKFIIVIESFINLNKFNVWNEFFGYYFHQTNLEKYIFSSVHLP